MDHEDREAAPTTAVVSVELTAQDGIRLAFPALSAARPTIVEPLALIAEAAHSELIRDRTPAASAQALEHAAAAVFSELQAYLAPLRGQRLEGSLRRELWDAHWQPVFALVSKRALAKQLQLAAADGQPLTVCFGKRARLVHTPTGPAKRVYPNGDGCGLVHPDSTGLRRPSFRIYCPTCRARETNRQQHAERDMLALWAGREPVLTTTHEGKLASAYYGTCRCGNDYLTTSARVTRCERCRRAHR